MSLHEVTTGKRGPAVISYSVMNMANYGSTVKQCLKLVAVIGLNESVQQQLQQYNCHQGVVATLHHHGSQI